MTSSGPSPTVLPVELRKAGLALPYRIEAFEHLNPKQTLTYLSFCYCHPIQVNGRKILTPDCKTGHVVTLQLMLMGHFVK